MASRRGHAEGGRRPAAGRRRAPLGTALGIGLVLAAGLPVPASAGPDQPVRSLGPEGPVTPVDKRRGFAHNSPLVVADPTEGRFLAMATRLDNPDFSCSLHLSGDGGRTWAPARLMEKLPEGAEKCYAPELAFDARGTLYYLFVGLRGLGNSPMGAFLVTSADRGRTFSAPMPVLGPERYMVRLAIDRAAADRGRLHLVWLEAGSDPPVGGLPPAPNPIMSSYSDDGGRTFSAPVQVSDPSRRRVVAPALALGPGHAVHVLYYDLEDDARDYQGLEGPRWEGKWSLVLSSSTDGGLGFGPGVTVDDAVAPIDRVMLIFTMPPPSLAADGEGRLYAAWHDARNGDWDALLRGSADAGRTWGPVRRLNDDARGTGTHQYMPRLAVAPSGRLDAVFYDRRRDPRNLRNDLFYATSADGGVTFAPNVRVTTESSTHRVGARYPIPSARGQFEHGSRIGLLAGPGGALAAWTEARHAEEGEGAQQVWSSRIEVEDPGGGRAWWPAAALAAAAAAGLVAALWCRRRRRGQQNPAGEELAHGEGALDEVELPVVPPAT